MIRPTKTPKPGGPRTPLEIKNTPSHNRRVKRNEDKTVDIERESKASHPFPEEHAEVRRTASDAREGKRELYRRDQNHGRDTCGTRDKKRPEGPGVRETPH